MNNKAFSLFSTKSLSENDNDDFIVEGIASTPHLDSDNDSLNSLGASFRSLPFPFILNHDHKNPVGQVVEAVPTNKGIKVKIRIPYVKEEGLLKTATDYAIHAIKYNVISGLSIGFSANKSDAKVNSKGGLDINKYEIYELSLTALQANSTAFITAFKSLKEEDLDSEDNVLDPNISNEADDPEGEDTLIEVISSEDTTGDSVDDSKQDESTIPINVEQPTEEPEAASDIVEVKAFKTVKLINKNTNNIKVSLK